MSPVDPRSLVELARSLADPGHRAAAGLYTLERHGAFLAAVDADFVIEGVVWCERLAGNDAVAVLVRRLRQRGVPVVAVTVEVFRGLCHGARASGVIALLRQRWVPIAKAPPGTWVGVDRIRSPGNLGTILRTVEACGGRGLVVVGDADPYDPQVVGSSMTGMLDLRFARATWPELRAWGRAQNVALIAASPTARCAWDRFDYPDNFLLWLGEERAGIGPGVAARCCGAVRIPILGRADSLNVGIAAGILLFEGLRQRRAREESTQMSPKKSEASPPADHRPTSPPTAPRSPSTGPSTPT